jgi:hypothetical protein
MISEQPFRLPSPTFGREGLRAYFAERRRRDAENQQREELPRSKYYWPVLQVASGYSPQGRCPPSLHLPYAVLYQKPRPKLPFLLRFRAWCVCNEPSELTGVVIPDFAEVFAAFSVRRHAAVAIRDDYDLDDEWRADDDFSHLQRRIVDDADNIDLAGAWAAFAPDRMK